MKSLLLSMQKKKNGIPTDVLPIFEGIIDKYVALGAQGSGEDCDNEFLAAMEQYLTQEQRYRIFEQNGGCKGTGYDKERKAFALEHARMNLADRFDLFVKKYGKNAVMNDDNTITVTFACGHGYYKRAREAKSFTPPPLIQSYFDRCAGGRLYELEKALGIKLKINSVDISPLDENILNPVVFTFDIVNDSNDN